MTLVLDAAPLVALADRGDPRCDEIQKTLEEEPGQLVLPAPVSAEVDYMLGERLGQAARRAFLADLAAGRFDVACLTPEDYPDLLALDARYADLQLGLSDCAIVVLARRFETRRILSFDERDLRAVSPLQGGSFELLPADG